MQTVNPSFPRAAAITKRTFQRTLWPSASCNTTSAQRRKTAKRASNTNPIPATQDELGNRTHVRRGATRTASFNRYVPPGFIRIRVNKFAQGSTHSSLGQPAPNSSTSATRTAYYIKVQRYWANLNRTGRRSGPQRSQQTTSVARTGFSPKVRYPVESSVR